VDRDHAAPHRLVTGDDLRGKKGWVNRSQLETTLTEGGGTQAFRDIALGDYLQRTFSVGAAYGAPRRPDGQVPGCVPVFRHAQRIESTFAQVQGVFSGTSLWHVNLQPSPGPTSASRPSSHRHRAIQERPEPQPGDTTDEPGRGLSDAIIGVNYHLSGRFVIRADYAIYTAFVSDARSTEYRAGDARALRLL